VAYDPVHQGQLYLRRAGHVFRRPAPEATRLDGLDEAAREGFFEVGRKNIAGLAARIEAHTGTTLEGRRALDFGCGVGRMSLPLAERCEHVYGLDVSPAVLREADSTAKEMNVGNVEWLAADRLAELDGQYDLVISMFVLQHIPSREGERIFATLLHGLRPGGVGAIHVTLRPSRPLSGLFRWTRKSSGPSRNPLQILRGLNWSYPYMLMHSYSLNTLARVLADAGVSEWHAKPQPTPATAWGSYDALTIVFRKD
jgi:SAM-dependent methyltransferase